MFAVLDGFFQARLLAEYQLLPPDRQAKVLPFIAAWCRRAEHLNAVDAARNLALIMQMHEKAVAATKAYDFPISPTSPMTAYAAEEPFEHIALRRRSTCRSNRLRRSAPAMTPTASRLAYRSSATVSTISARCASRARLRCCVRCKGYGRSRQVAVFVVRTEATHGGTLRRHVTGRPFGSDRGEADPLLTRNCPPRQTGPVIGVNRPCSRRGPIDAIDRAAKLASCHSSGCKSRQQKEIQPLL
jgi:hypothetical protein